MTEAENRKHEATLRALEASPHATVVKPVTSAWLLGKDSLARVKSALGR